MGIGCRKTPGSDAVLDLSAGLTGHWKFDETSGAVAVDSSGNGRHGIYSDNYVLGREAPMDNGALMDYQDGSTIFGFVALPDANYWPSGSWTISYWRMYAIVKSESLATGFSGNWSAGVIFRGNYFIEDTRWGTTSNFGGSRFHLNFDGGGSEDIVQPIPGSSVDARSDNQPHWGSWDHICITGSYNGSQTDVKIYTNGNLLSQNTISGAMHDDDQWIISSASQATSVSHVGQTRPTVDEMRVYDRALTEAEVQSLAYNKAGIDRYANLIKQMCPTPAYYRMQRPGGGGTVLNDGWTKDRLAATINVKAGTEAQLFSFPGPFANSHDGSNLAFSSFEGGSSDAGYLDIGSWMQTPGLSDAEFTVGINIWFKPFLYSSNQTCSIVQNASKSDIVQWKRQSGTTYKISVCGTDYDITGAGTDWMMITCIGTDFFSGSNPKVWINGVYQGQSSGAFVPRYLGAHTDASGDLNGLIANASLHKHNGNSYSPGAIFGGGWNDATLARIYDQALDYRF